MNKEGSVTHEEHKQSDQDVVGGPEVRHVEGELARDAALLSSRWLRRMNYTLFVWSRPVQS